MRLEKDIYGIDNKLLIKAGQDITDAALGKLALQAERINYVKIKNTTLAKDIKNALRDKRYKSILLPEKINKKILSTADNISVPENIVSELKAIRRCMPYTYRHVLILSILSTKIALDGQTRNKYDPYTVMGLGLVHDIGKSRISPKALDKRSPLTRLERKTLKTHPLIGFILLHYYYGKRHRLYDYASYEHHERIDGSGYPRRLKRINKYARLLAVVDILDALVSSRPYRKTPFTLRAALDYILGEAKRGRLDKEAARILVSYARKDKPPIKMMKVSRKKRDPEPEDNVYGMTAVK